MKRMNIAINKLNDRFESYYYSRLYLWITGAVVLFSGLFALEVFAFYYIVINLVLSSLFCKSTKPAVMLVISVVFAVSYKHYPSWNNPSEAEQGFLSSPFMVGTIIFLAVICAAAFIAHLVIYKKFSDVFVKPKRLASGLLFFAVALLLNGFGFEGYTIKNLWFAAIEAVAFLFIYFYFSGTLSDDDSGYEYFCHASAVALLIVFIEVSVKFFAAAYGKEIVSKNDIFLGWGVSNNIGVIFVLTMPACAYLAIKTNKSYIYFSLLALGMFGTLFTLSRASILTAVGVIAATVIYFVTKKRSDKKKIVSLVGVALASIIIMLSLWGLVPKFFDFLIKTKMDDRGRFELWKIGFEWFMKSPSFGVGFGYDDLSFSKNYFFGLITFHNTPIQLLAACGLFGLAGYIVMRAQSIMLFVEKPTEARFFMAVAVGALIVNSLLDNHIFYFYPMFLYMFNLIYAERDLNITVFNSPLYIPER